MILSLGNDMKAVSAAGKKEENGIKNEYIFQKKKK